MYIRIGVTRKCTGILPICVCGIKEYQQWILRLQECYDTYNTAKYGVKTNIRLKPLERPEQGCVCWGRQQMYSGIAPLSEATV